MHPAIPLIRIPSMPHDRPTEFPTARLRDHLRDLHSELALAHESGLDENATYMAHLTSDVALTKAAYVGAAVTEIATLRAALSGPLLG